MYVSGLDHEAGALSHCCAPKCEALIECFLKEAQRFTACHFLCSLLIFLEHYCLSNPSFASSFTRNKASITIVRT